LSIYDGRCIGHLISRGKLGYEAFTANDRSLGLFANQAAGAAAISNDWGRS
jgi:hypothetical protein